jgi:hypothetical protein
MSDEYGSLEYQGACALERLAGAWRGETLLQVVCSKGYKKPIAKVVLSESGPLIISRTRPVGRVRLAAYMGKPKTGNVDDSNPAVALPEHPGAPARIPIWCPRCGQEAEDTERFRTKIAAARSGGDRRMVIP